MKTLAFAIAFPGVPTAAPQEEPVTPEDSVRRLSEQVDKIKLGFGSVSQQPKLPREDPDKTLRRGSKDDGDRQATYVSTTPLKRKDR